MNLSSPSLSNASGSASSSLIRRLKVRDPDAWQRLAKMFGPLVYGWARESGLQESDASDVMQETFRAVAAKIETFDRTSPSDRFRGWLWTITRNKIRDHFRNQAGRAPAVGGADHDEIMAQIPAEAPEPGSLSETAQSTIAHIARQTLELVRAEFEPRTWQAFWLITVEDKRPADVAASLQMSLGAAYMAKSRVLKRLREELVDFE
ncbi:MAG: RNA polymerase sigma factor [Pirellulaceae bacterium]